jgi:hypothetical protein
LRWRWAFWVCTSCPRPSTPMCGTSPTRRTLLLLPGPHRRALKRQPRAVAMVSTGVQQGRTWRGRALRWRLQARARTETASPSTKTRRSNRPCSRRPPPAAARRKRTSAASRETPLRSRGTEEIRIKGTSSGRLHPRIGTGTVMTVTGGETASAMSPGAATGIATVIEIGNLALAPGRDVYLCCPQGVLDAGVRIRLAYALGCREHCASGLADVGCAVSVSGLNLKLEIICLPS